MHCCCIEKCKSLFKWTSHWHTIFFCFRVGSNPTWLFNTISLPCISRVRNVVGALQRQCRNDVNMRNISVTTRRTSPVEPAGETGSDSCSSGSSAEGIGANTTGKTKVLYDGDCPICIQEIKVLKYLNQKKDAIHFVDLSKPGYDQLEHNNIPLEEAMGIMHVVTPDNKVHTRLDAVDAMYRAVGWGWSTGFVKWPILSPTLERAYMWFARNRLRLTGRQSEGASCKVPDA